MDTLSVSPEASRFSKVSNDFTKNYNQLHVILPLYSQRGKKSSMNQKPELAEKIQAIKKSGVLTSRRNITQKTRSNVSQMVADLEDVLNFQEKNVINGTTPKQVTKNTHQSEDGELHAPPSQEQLKILRPNKQTQIEMLSRGPPTVGGQSRNDLESSKGFTFNKIIGGWGVVASNKSPPSFRTFNFHQPVKQANINRVELELTNFQYPPNQNSDLVSTRGFEKRHKRLKKKKQNLRKSFGQPTFEVIDGFNTARSPLRPSTQGGKFLSSMPSLKTKTSMPQIEWVDIIPRTALPQFAATSVNFSRRSQNDQQTQNATPLTPPTYTGSDNISFSIPQAQEQPKKVNKIIVDDQQKAFNIRNLENEEAFSSMKSLGNGENLQEIVEKSRDNSINEITFMNRPSEIKIQSFGNSMISTERRAHVKLKKQRVMIKPKNFRIDGLKSDNIKSLEWFQKSLKEPVQKILQFECSRRKKLQEMSEKKQLRPISSIIHLNAKKSKPPIDFINHECKNIIVPQIQYQNSLIDEIVQSSSIFESSQKSEIKATTSRNKEGVQKIQEKTRFIMKHHFLRKSFLSNEAQNKLKQQIK